MEGTVRGGVRRPAGRLAVQLFPALGLGLFVRPADMVAGPWLAPALEAPWNVRRRPAGARPAVAVPDVRARIPAGWRHSARAYRFSAAAVLAVRPGLPVYGPGPGRLVDYGKGQVILDLADGARMRLLALTLDSVRPHRLSRTTVSRETGGTKPAVKAAKAGISVNPGGPGLDDLRSGR